MEGRREEGKSRNVINEKTIKNGGGERDRRVKNARIGEKERIILTTHGRERNRKVIS